MECGEALLTNSATAALEMQGLLLDLAPGDEVIMPSYTFVTTASAIAQRQAVPVFVDIRRDTLNLDERLVESAITPRTRAIMAVHYGGVACEMDALDELAQGHGLALLEDAAHALRGTYHGRPLGSLGILAALSFHETKNVHCGEGGALLINDPELVERSKVLWEKGTNRSRFLRGEVDKYTWVDTGSSFQPSELSAAFLLAQLESLHAVQARRLEIWNTYHAAFEPLEHRGFIRQPSVPQHCQHSGHLYYLVLNSLAARDAFIAGLSERGIGATFHYVPLHSSPAGQRLGRPSGKLPVTIEAGDGLVRLPLWTDMTWEVAHVIESVFGVVEAMPRH